jgi:hypothetical protein
VIVVAGDAAGYHLERLFATPAHSACDAGERVADGGRIAVADQCAVGATAPAVGHPRQPG